MSYTVTISDDLYCRLAETARRRGLGNVEQLLETVPGSDADVSRFQGLAQQWKKDTAHLSNISKKALHPAYQEIIGMGKAAVPLLLAELQREPDDWFWHCTQSPERARSHRSIGESSRIWPKIGSNGVRSTVSSHDRRS